MSRASRAFRRGTKIIKGIFFAMIFSVMALLLWRILSSGDPKEIRALTVNQNVVAAYEEADGELYMFRQNLNRTTYGKNNYGYFTVTECIFIPEANQVQLIFRYNNSTLRALAEDYKLSAMPDRDDELYDMTLVIATDLTPDDTSDNAGNDPESVAFTRIKPVSVTTEQKNLYNYRRFVFDLGEAGLDLSELTGEGGLMLAAYADIYYVEDINYDEKAYGTLCVYDYLQKRREVKLTASDRRALEAGWEE